MIVFVGLTLFSLYQGVNAANLSSCNYPTEFNNCSIKCETNYSTGIVYFARNGQNEYLCINSLCKSTKNYVGFRNETSVIMIILSLNKDTAGEWSCLADGTYSNKILVKPLQPPFLSYINNSTELNAGELVCMMFCNINIVTFHHVTIPKHWYNSTSVACKKDSKNECLEVPTCVTMVKMSLGDDSAGKWQCSSEDVFSNTIFIGRNNNVINNMENMTDKNNEVDVMKKYEFCVCINNAVLNLVFVVLGIICACIRSVLQLKVWIIKQNIKKRFLTLTGCVGVVEIGSTLAVSIIILSQATCIGICIILSYPLIIAFGAMIPVCIRPLIWWRMKGKEAVTKDDKKSPENSKGRYKNYTGKSEEGNSFQYQQEQAELTELNT